jgi:hypothetical protein
MPDRAKTPSPIRDRDESGDGTALLEEIAAQKEEILRLRDLLIAKDAELGTAKGRLTELTEHSARFVVAARAIQARVPGLLRKAARLLRRG